MTGRKGNLWILILLLVILGCCYAIISDKRLCYDEDCSVVVSLGKTTLPYPSKDPDVMSFPANEHVKIFSKHAGSRQDLWGVEIRNKRGYAPAKFIRETKVIKSKLEHLVPTEDISIKNSEKIIPDKTDKPSENQNGAGNILEQKISDQVMKAEYKLNTNTEEKINPNLVTPTYESIIDGTISSEIEDVEPPTPSLSTQTFEEPAKEKEAEEMQSYPNLLSSTFSAISDIWNGSEDDEEDEDSDKENNDDITLMEKSTTEEKLDESSTESSTELDKDEKPMVKLEMIPSGKFDELVAESDDILIENNQILKTETDVPYSDDKNKVSEIEEPEINDKLVTESENSPPKSVFQIIVESPEINNSDSKNDHAAVNILVKPVLNESSSDSNTDSPKTPKKTETADVTSKNENLEENISTEEKPKNILENTLSDEAVSIKNNEQETLSSTILSTLDNSEASLKSEEKTIPIDLQHDVPTQEKIPDINDNLFKVDNFKNAPAEKAKLDKLEISVNETSVNSENIEVPLKDEIVGDSITDSPQNFISHQELLTPNILENYSVPVLNEAEINSGLNATDLNIIETKTIDNSLNFEENSGDNIIPDSNNNIEESKGPTVPTYLQNDSTVESSDTGFQSGDSSQEHIVDIPSSPSFGEFLGNRNLLNAGKNFQYDDSTEIRVDKILTDDKIAAATSSEDEENGRGIVTKVEEIKSLEESNIAVETETSVIDKNLYESKSAEETNSIEINEEFHEKSSQNKISATDENLIELKQIQENVSFEEIPPDNSIEKIVVPLDTCDADIDCSSNDRNSIDENAVTDARKMEESTSFLFSSKTIEIVCATAVTILSLCLGVYFMENKRRDAKLIAKINILERDLMITKKKCIELDTNFKSTKTQLDSTVGESIDSIELVAALKNELATSESAKADLEDQVATLEKELETASEAGLELERMLREMLASQTDPNNPLDRSIENLKDRLNDQQKANETLKTSLALKSQENETLSRDLTESLKKIEQLQNEVSELSEELQAHKSSSIDLEQTLTDQIQTLGFQVTTLTEEKSLMRKQIKKKDSELNELLRIADQTNLKNIDFERLYDTAHIKAEVENLTEERDELKIKLNDQENSHLSLQEHLKTLQEEVVSLGEQCRIAEKDKKEAETRLEVLTKFFEEKEAQRQKEEAVWLEKQGEVSSTVERIHTMKNEILNYKQQIELLKREILDQEREYKNQMSVLETKAHEQWLTARQNERRLEEVKAECSQLRNRLTLVEKNMGDDAEGKMHRLQSANGETVGPPHPHHPLYVGVGETSSSPLMFGSGGPVPPPPSHMFLPPPPFLPPPLPPPSSGAPPVSGSASELVTGSRPPPLGGGRLSSPPPPGSSSSNNPAGSPPPLSPPLHMLPPLPHFPHPLHMHRSPPPFDHHHHMPPPPLYSHPHRPPPGDTWGDHDTLPIPPPTTTSRNSTGAFHPHQRDPRARNHNKGSLHSSGESLDKSHGGKV